MLHGCRLQSGRFGLSRRAFAASLVPGLPGVACAAGEHPGPRSTFLDDLARSYEQQLIGVDMDDVNAVLAGIRAPRLGRGTASAGDDRAEAAALAALADVGQVGRHSLVVIASAAGGMRLREYKAAFNVVRAASPADSVIIYAPCVDRSLAPGTARVSLLTG